MFTSSDLSAIFLTFKLATLTTLILLVLCTPLAWWLSQKKTWCKEIVGALVSLPLVLPPTVLGFYLLILMGPHGAFGRLTTSLGWGPLTFTFSGLVIGSVLYSMPFVVQPIQNAFQAMGATPFEIAATLQANPLHRFLLVALPMAKNGILTAAILGFAHTVGEFGVVLMIGGNIPDQTRVLSIAIYDHVETLHYENAGMLSAGLLGFSFLILFALQIVKRRGELKHPTDLQFRQY